MIARTGDAITHAYWGRVVHDLAGMEHKPRIPIDFNHNPDDVIGYANRFNTSEGDLEIKGALTPYKGSDRATEILHKANVDAEEGGGVPYEASINFAGDFEVEKLGPNDTAVLNQRTFSGPLTIIRKWKLRGVAITPYGYDPGTQTEFANQMFSYTVINEEQEMSKDTTDTEAIDVLNTETDNRIETSTAVDVADSDSSETTAAQPEVVDENRAEETASAEDAKETAQAFMTRFGRVQGALYFADGLSIAEATGKEIERLQKENAELRNAQAVADQGLDEPVEFSRTDAEAKDVLTKMPGEVALPESTDGNNLRFR